MKENCQMLKQVVLEGFENNLKTIKVKAITLKDGKQLYHLVDANGSVCSGFHDTEAQAKSILPNVAYNLYRGKIPARLATKPKFQPKRK